MTPDDRTTRLSNIVKLRWCNTEARWTLEDLNETQSGDGEISLLILERMRWSRCLRFIHRLHTSRTGATPGSLPLTNVILNRLALTPPAGDEWANICMSVGKLGDLSELTWRLHILSALYFTSQLNVFEPVKPRRVFESYCIHTSVLLT